MPCRPARGRVAHRKTTTFYRMCPNARARQGGTTNDGAYQDRKCVDGHRRDPDRDPGHLVWADATVMAWYQGLSYLVLGVGLLLWSIPAVFSPAASGARPAEAGAQRSGA